METKRSLLLLLLFEEGCYGSWWSSRRSMETRVVVEGVVELRELSRDFSRSRRGSARDGTGFLLEDRSADLSRGAEFRHASFVLRNFRANISTLRSAGLFPSLSLLRPTSCIRLRVFFANKPINAPLSLFPFPLEFFHFEAALLPSFYSKNLNEGKKIILNLNA